jgi:hypothetical protein
LNSVDRRLKVVSAAPAAKAWLVDTRQAHVLYSFNTVVDLINQEGDVLSLVDNRIGDGPFSLVLEPDVFPQDIEAEASLLVFENGLWLGDWLIDVEQAQDWHPRPNWAALAGKHGDLMWSATRVRRLLEQHAQEDSLARLVLDPTANSTLPTRVFQAAEQNIPLLYAGLVSDDGPKISEASKKLAGLGPGLTPAGDDLLLGATYGLWTTQGEDAELTAKRIANAAIPRTHALSAAWLAAGARGEAAEAWHQLLTAIGSRDETALEAAVMRILPTGHTSGADALGGFLGVLEAPR